MNKFVSVIIPLYNDTKRLEMCLNALTHQTYPKECYEIIVIDNNSTESLENLISTFPQVRFDYEPTQGSYAARNKGIDFAKGEIYAFTDSDCVPISQWIEKGVRSLEAEQADMVGGNVKFSFSPAKTAAEIYDSITNIQIRKGIEQRKVCKTANLFVRQRVFESIGLFPNHLKSGGDVIWTQKATDAQFKLVYSSAAEVYHPARKIRSLLKKQYRVGNGQPDIWLEQQESIGQIAKRIIKGLKPPSPRKFLKNIKLNRVEVSSSKLLSLWLTAWICRITTNLGRINRLSKEIITIK